MSDEEFEPPVARRKAKAKNADRRRRALVGVGAAGAVAFILGLVVGSSSGGDEPPAKEAKEAGPEELPRGGRSLLPEYRLVGFYGAPQDDALGARGIGTPAEASKRLLEQAKAYEGRKPVMPVYELIATIASAHPGEDGLYRTRQPHSVIKEFLAEARRNRGILLLDIQPGRADFDDEVRRLKRYLDEPDVGLALDPEWHVGPDELPGDVIGSIGATEVNQIAEGLAETVERLDLPEKLFVIHQFTGDMITSKELLVPQDALATVLNVDGFGDAPNKIAKYDELHPKRATGLASGFKLFYEEDFGLMTPDDVLGLKPPPDLIVYE
jgi:hypothetical protein